MSLAAPITLAEARQSVLVRVGMGIQGNQSATSHGHVDELIRSAVRQLFVEAAWTVLRLQTTIPLTANQSEVDWPDDSEPGSLLSVVAVNTNGNQVDVFPGLRTNERESARTASGRPTTYYYRDGSIFLLPAASASWTSLIVNYTASSGSILEDDDQIPVDAEACIQHAALAFKRYWALPVTPEDSIRFQRYVDQIRANQSEGDGFVIGGRKSTVIHKANRVTRGRLSGNGAPWSTDWNPY